MKILRGKEKKEKTPEEKELEDYKKAKNIGLAAMGTGAAAVLGSRIPKAIAEYKKNHPDSNLDKNNTSKGDYRRLGIGGLVIGGTGLALHGLSALKYRKLKKKLKEMKEEEDDNTKKKD